jgi:hypothetical protein
MGDVVTIWVGSALSHVLEAGYECERTGPFEGNNVGCEREE